MGTTKILKIQQAPNACQKKNLWVSWVYTSVWLLSGFFEDSLCLNSRRVYKTCVDFLILKNKIQETLFQNFGINIFT